MALPIDYHPVCAGWYISDEALENIREVGPASKWYDSALVEFVATNHKRVFSDLKRDGFDEADCHVGVPLHRFNDDGNEVPRTAGRVLCVFSTREQFGNVVFDWEWRPGNAETGYPDDWRDHFGQEKN